MMQDIKQQIGVCVLDPHGELIDHVIARLPGKSEEDKVVFLNIADYQYPFGLNLFACSDLTNPVEVEKTVDRVMHVFDKLLGVSDETPLISQYLLHSTHTLVANPGYTMAEIPLLLTDSSFRQTLVANVRKQQTRLFWHEYYNPMPIADQRRERMFILRRVERFLQEITLPNVGQSSSTIDLQKIMEDGKILLVKLDPQMEQVTTLVGSLLIALLLNAAYARPTHKRRQFHLYADEFERFATEDFATLLEQARKFGIATTIAHQNRGQLNSANCKLQIDLKDRSRSVANLVVLKINGKDAEELAAEFDCTPPPALLDRREKEFVISEKVVETLLSLHGYSHPAIGRFVENYLKPMVDGTKMEIDITDQSEWHGPVYYWCPRLPDQTTRFDPERLKEVLYKDLNHFLHRVMKERNPKLPIPLEVMLACGAAFSFSGSYHHDMKFERLLNDDMLRILGEIELDLSKGVPAVKQAGLFTRSLRSCMEALAAQPLMVDSGRFEMKPGTQRTYNDMKNEIATTLANLPQYTARIKIAGGEHTIRTLPPERGISWKELQERIARIQARNRTDC